MIRQADSGQPAMPEKPVAPPDHGAEFRRKILARLRLDEEEFAREHPWRNTWATAAYYASKAFVVLCFLAVFLLAIISSCSLNTAR